MMKDSAGLYNLSDTALISKANLGDHKAAEVLILRYSNIVFAISKSYYSCGLTGEDWYQEGIIGLIRAINTFDAAKSASFKTYAAVCIKNRLNSLWRSEKSKHEVNSEDLIKIDDSPSPEDEYIEKEVIARLAELFDSALSPTERDVLKHYFAGFSYEQTAKVLGISKKAVDNALFRAKNKLKNAYE